MKNPQYFPKELLQTTCDYKLFSLPFPALMGGPGEHIMASFITYELVASYCVGVAEPLARIPDFKIYFWLFSGGVGGSVRDAAFNSDFANWAFKKYARKQSEKMRNAVTAYSDVAKVSCTDLALENCQKAISLMVIHARKCTVIKTNGGGKMRIMHAFIRTWFCVVIAVNCTQQFIFP